LDDELSGPDVEFALESRVLERANHLHTGVRHFGVCRL